MMVKEIWMAAGEGATIVRPLHKYNSQWVMSDELHTQTYSQSHFGLHKYRLVS